MISSQDHLHRPPDLTIEPSPLSSTDTFSAGTPHPSNTIPLPATAQLAHSFSAISEQLLTASRALSRAHRSSNGDSEAQDGSDAQPQWASALSARLDAIEAAQRALRADIDALRDGETLSVSVANGDGTEAPSNADLARQIAELKEAMLLRESQLYAKLHNARAQLPKHAVLAPPTKGGRPPQNFPATRGEFEHLTRERYEAILKAYDQPLKGDTAAKRQAARVFLGLPAEEGKS